MANLLNLSIPEVKIRLEKEHKNKLVRNLFKDRWPKPINKESPNDDDGDEDVPDYITLGNMKVKDVLSYNIDLTESISDYAGKHSTTIKKYLKNASPNEIINNAVKDYDLYLDPDILGSLTITRIRTFNLACAVAFVINNKKINIQKVEERILGENGNKLIKNVFSDIWPS